MRSLAPALLAVWLTAPWLPGCETARVPEPDSSAASAETPPPLDRFSAERAWADLEALTALGPRAAGPRGAEQARAYLRAELQAIGLEVGEIETTRHVEGLEDLVLHHVTATLPGAAPGRFLLLTPYDSSHFESFPFVGANDGASGAALLLELARVLSNRSLPYTTQLVFLEGEGRANGDAEGPAAGRWYGSAGLAEQMRQSGELEDIRLLVAFHQVGDADLHIVRDLSSHRMHREEFFRAARRVGRAAPFPLELGFESAAGSHLAFRDRGLRPVVVITDTRYGGDQVPGAWAESADDTLARCSRESLEAVGIVTLEALEVIGRRLARIERFARSPLGDVEREASEAPAPGAEPEVAPDAATPAPEPDAGAPDAPAPGAGPEPRSESPDAPPVLREPPVPSEPEGPPSEDPAPAPRPPSEAPAPETPPIRLDAQGRLE